MVGSDGGRGAVVGGVVATVGAFVTVVGTFLPWVRSGSRDRSSFAIFDLVERLGFAPDGAIAWSLRLWPLAPLAMVMVAIGVWTAPSNRRLVRPLTVGASLAVVWVGATAVAVLTAPAVGLFRIGAGPGVTLLGAVVTAAGAGSVVVLSRRESAASADA